MKQFNTLERDIISNIVQKEEDVSLFYIFQDIIKSYKSVRLDLQLEQLQYPKTTKYNVKQLVTDLTNAAMLLRYLDYHKYIYPIDNRIENEDVSIEPAIRLQRDFNYIEIRSDVIQIIYYSQHKFHITDDLQFVVQHNFLTYEDMQLAEAKSQTKKARWTLMIAVFTLLATCIIPFILPLISYTHYHEDEIHRETISNIRSILPSINQSTHAIIDAINSHQDSIANQPLQKENIK